MGLSHCAAQIPQTDVSNIPSADALTTQYCGCVPSSCGSRVVHVVVVVDVAVVVVAAAAAAAA